MRKEDSGRRFSRELKLAAVQAHGDGREREQAVAGARRLARGAVFGSPLLFGRQCHDSAIPRHSRH